MDRWWRGGRGGGVQGLEGWELQYSAIRTGSVLLTRAFKISDANGSVVDTLRCDKNVEAAMGI